MVNIQYRIENKNFPSIGIGQEYSISATISVYVRDFTEPCKVIVVATHSTINGKFFDNDLEVLFGTRDTNFFYGAGSYNGILTYKKLEKLFKEIKNTIFDLSKDFFFLEDFILILKNDFNLEYRDYRPIERDGYFI